MDAFKVFQYLLVFAGILFIVYMKLMDYTESTRKERSERRRRQELYDKGYAHGRSGYKKDPDHRTDYVRGYAEGVKARSELDTRPGFEHKSSNQVAQSPITQKDTHK